MEMMVVMRSISAISPGIIATLVVFGLVISLMWLVGSDTRSYKLTTIFISSGLAIVVGGLSLGVIIRRDRIIVSALFGFSFGFISSAYVLGSDWRVLAFAAAASVLGGTGGIFSKSLFEQQRDQIE
jgi:hypothetical protein